MANVLCQLLIFLEKTSNNKDATNTANISIKIGKLKINSLFNPKKLLSSSSIYKEIILKPMDQEEAMLQLEALGLDYYIYKDLNDDINVIYKRKNGYGVINTK